MTGLSQKMDGILPWSQTESLVLLNGSPNRLSYGVFPLPGGLEPFADSNNLP